MISYVLSALKECIAAHLNPKATLSVSSFEDYHFQLPLFFQIKDPSVQQAVVQAIEAHPAFEKAQKTGAGFLSLKLNLQYFVDKLQTPLPHEPKTVVVDYCGVNVAKQMHIGHIRSMFIGDYIANAHLAANDKCVLQNHIGDWGSQFGYLLGYLIQSGQIVENNKALTEIYKAAYAKYQEDSEFKEYAHSISEALTKGDENTVALWKKLVNLSMAEAAKFFELFNLNISLDDTCGESFYDKAVSAIVQDLCDKGLVVESEGALVAFFDKEKMSPLILKKTSGAYLYAAYDLAAIKYRVETFNPDKIVYVVDKRQELHFKQVFSLAKKAGYAQNVELQHVGFGTILGDNKKPIKTREGKSLYLDDLLAQGVAQYQATPHYQVLVDSGLQNSGIDTKSVIGALKFYDLHLASSEDYVFDWAYVLNTQGNSAPYLQNAFVRIDSILFKAKNNSLVNLPYSQKIIDFNEFGQMLAQLPVLVKGLDLAGLKLLFTTMLLNAEINAQATTYASYKLCSAMLDVAKAFHSFYENTKVIGADNQSQLEALLGFVGLHLFEGMKLLGIEPYPCIQNMKL